ncbi:MAG: urease accessory protein UreD [Desulfopila sp.]
MTARLTAAGEGAGWQAHLQLGYRRRGDITILAENSHRGPLRVQQPLYPEGGVCHTCILHPPGGVVGGDQLALRLDVDRGAHALVTTPGATKFYRCSGRGAVLHQRLRANAGRLEWLSQDTIVFPGADAEIVTEVFLDEAASFIGWEVLCLGLPTRGERFDHGRLRSAIVLHRDGRPLFVDRLSVCSAADLDSPAGLRSLPVSATMLATGVEQDQLTGLAELLPMEEGMLAAMTLQGDLLVIRCLGDSTFTVREVFQAVWRLLRPHLFGRPPCPPRIWST